MAARYSTIGGAALALAAMGLLAGGLEVQRDRLPDQEPAPRPAPPTEGDSRQVRRAKNRKRR